MGSKWIARAPVLGAWLVAWTLISCSTASPTEPIGVPSPSPAAASPAPSLRSTDLFAGLPYSLDLPEGWVGGGPESYQAQLDAISTLNPELWEQVELLSPPLENEFIGVEASGDMSMAVNTLEIPVELTTDRVLDEAQAQNLEAVRQLPGVAEEPSTRRVQLPVGESAEISWAGTIDRGAGPELRRNVGYLIVGGRTLYTVMFAFGERDRGADIQAIIESFHFVNR